MATLLRTLLVSAAIGCAAAFACCGDWTSVIAAIVIVPVILQVCAALAAGWDILREQAAGKHHKPPVLAYVCSRCGEPGVTEWPDEEAAATGQRIGLDLVCDGCLTGALRIAARSAG